ncbi:MAG: hypothetical protein WAV07_06085 [Candidatus Contendobacter sp.]
MVELKIGKHYWIQYPSGNIGGFVEVLRNEGHGWYTVTGHGGLSGDEGKYYPRYLNINALVSINTRSLHRPRFAELFHLIQRDDDHLATSVERPYKNKPFDLYNSGADIQPAPHKI